MSVKVIHPNELQTYLNNAQSEIPRVTKTFFDIFGTSGCLLNCEAERNLEEVFEYNKEKYDIKSKQDRKRVRAARIAHVKQHEGTRQEWFTASEITASATSGCGSCNVLKQIIQILLCRDEEICDGFEYSVARDFQLSRRSRGAKEPDVTVQLFQYPGSNVQFELFYQSNFLLGSENSISRLQGWMAECLSGHENCSKSDATQDKHNRPARLLDLTPISREGELGIRLIETTQTGTYQYACLSHRWDTALKHHQTTQDNLTKALEFLHLRVQPKNFQDAVHIARQLNIQYLWIDSLCIIQGGNGDDLRRELAKMAYIYRNARLTIAIVSSPDSSEGCFMHNKWPDTCLSITSSKNEHYLLGARILDKKGQSRSTSEVNAHYPLLNRAWVFQERLLSTRLLECNYGEFAFQCLESSRCECDSLIAPHIGRNSHRSRNSNLVHQRRLIVQGAQSLRKQGARDAWKHDVLNYWKNIIEVYMQLELSYPADVLPAIAGCAQVLAEHLKFRYVAGMWREMLATDLLWYVTPTKARETVKPRPKDSTAPSWSWASVAMGQSIAHVHWMGDRSLSMSDVLLRDAIKDIHCEPLSEVNPFGKLKSASLRLEAVLYPWYLHFFCRLYKQEMICAYRRSSKDLFIKRDRPDGFVDCRTEIQELDVQGKVIEISLDVRLGDEGLAVEPFSRCIKGPPNPCALAQIYLLHALHKENRSPRRMFDVFLILMRTAPVGDMSNCYRRIGLMKMTNVGMTARTWRDIVDRRMEFGPEEFWLL